MAEQKTFSDRANVLIAAAGELLPDASMEELQALFTVLAERCKRVVIQQHYDQIRRHTEEDQANG